MHILMWKYADNSAPGVVTCSTDEQTIQNLLDLLSEHGDPGKQFKVVKQTPVVYTFEEVQ